MARFTGTDAGEAIVGGDEDDLLEGRGGDNLLDGAGGIDRLEGGLGDDRYLVGETRREVEGVFGYWSDETVEAADAGIDTAVWMGLGGYRLTDNVENGEAGTRFGGTLWGNDLGNVLTGWTGSFDGNWLYGEGGDDRLSGGDGGDHLFGGAGADRLVGYAGETEETLSLDSDELDGGEGADVMIGGRGYDIYWADDVGDTIVEVAIPEGADDTETEYYSHDTVYWTGQGTYELALDVDILHLRGGATAAAGNAQGNVLFSDYGGYTQWGELIGEGDATLDGAGGDDFVFGGSGADALFGGEGADTLDGLDGSDTVHGGAGDDTVHGDSTQLFSASDDTLFGDEGDDRLEGDNGDDVLAGGDGDDVLIGGYGDDGLTGGAGVDRFGFGQNDDLATDFTNGEDLILGEFGAVAVTQDGADTLITYQGEMEWDRGTLRLVGVDAATITADDFVSYREGTVYDDTVTGTEGDDYVSGGDGDDGVDGGTGDDGADGGAGDDDVDGGDGDDDVAGGTGDDDVDGGAGNDETDGGSGDDDVSGGGGDDEVDGGDGDDDLSGGGGSDDVDGGEGDDEMTGGGGDDDLDGGEGDDWLWGGTGDDEIDGGAGDDVVVVTDWGDWVVDTGGGTDTVEATVSMRLGRGVENLVLGGGAPAGARLAVDAAAPVVRGLKGTGNALDNAITGSAGGDRLFGRGGDDRLVGDAGDDRLVGGSGADRLEGGAGADTFVLVDGADRDRVADFRADQGDAIEIHSAAVRRFGQLTITEDRGDALVSWRGGSVTLAGVHADTLDAGDFRFAGAAAFARDEVRPHDQLWSAPTQPGWDTVLA